MKLKEGFEDMIENVYRGNIPPYAKVQMERSFMCGVAYVMFIMRKAAETRDQKVGEDALRAIDDELHAFTDALLSQMNEHAP